MSEIGLMVRDATLDLAERLSNLAGEQWNAQSLCSAWRIRDVLAHVTAGAQGAFGVGAVASGLVRYRFDYNRWVAVDGQTRGQLDPDIILKSFRDTADTGAALSGRQATRALAHVVIHGQDICRPLGVARELPESHLVTVADFAATSLIFRAKKHIAGVRLSASDADWSHGTGPEVTGPAEALVMMMAGRLVALGDLNGEGLFALRRAIAK